MAVRRRQSCLPGCHPGGVYALFEAALKALGQKPLIAMHETWWHWISTLPGNVNPVIVALAGLASVFSD